MLLWAQQYYCLFHVSKNYFMANELQDGSKVVDFQKRSSTKDGLFKVARNYSYVASTTAINNAAASQLPAIKLITR